MFGFATVTAPGSTYDLHISAYDEKSMNDDNKVERMVKVWNAPWAMRELGWL